MTMRRIVVVGNGIAGVTACDALRSAGFDGELVVVGGERHRAYSRPALSKALLHGGDELTAHHLPEPTHEATELLGVRATGLDPAARRVRLESGDELEYDGLVIASGSRARRLSSGDAAAEASGEFTLRTIDDALALKQRLAARPSVIVIGGGPLGMEAASGCVHAGCEVTLVSDVDPLSRQLGGYLSGVFAQAATAHGLRIVRAGRARLVHGDDGPRVALPDGTALEAELVITAIGDDPDVDWLAGSGLTVDGAVRVDSRGRVRPGIVAAGDVASFPHARGVGRVPLWTSAIDQAKVAAVGLLADEDAPELDFRPYFWTEAFGLSLKAVGYTPVAGEPARLERGEAPNSMLLRWQHADGSGTAAAVNYRIPVPRLRRLALGGPAVLAGPAARR